MEKRLKVEQQNRKDSATHLLMREFEQRIVASPPGVCPIDMQLSFLRVCHAQSCGKCVPCRVGLGQLANLLEDVLENRATLKTLDLIKETARNIQHTADCAIGFEAARMIRVGLEAAEDDYLSHIKDHRCTASFEQPIPCVTLCPAKVDIPGYIALVGEERYEDAIRLIRKDNPFPTACALICEHPCEARCRRNMIDSAVNIRGLKRFAVEQIRADKAAVPKNAPSTGKRVAIIGAGPSGLTTAYYLQLMGHQTTVFEEKEQAGGMLRYGIPNYRFPRERLQEDIDAILSTGVTLKCNTKVGTDITFEQLRSEYDAIYLAIGAHKNKKFDVEGVDSNGVISAVEMLRKIGYGEYPDFSGKSVVVIGGGNVAMDCARTAIRCKAEKVSVVYRRRQKDMTALESEIEGTIAEGVELLTLEAPLHFEADENGQLKALWVQPQISGAYDKEGRPSPNKAKKSEERLECEVALVAIGQDIDSDYFANEGIPVKRGRIMADEYGIVQDTEGVFAGGDCVSGPATVIKAIAAGKAAAANIDEYLGFHHEISCDVEIPQAVLKDKVQSGRIHLTEREACVRKSDFIGVEKSMSLEEAQRESNRCLRCDHFGCAAFRGGREEVW